MSLKAYGKKIEFPLVNQSQSNYIKYLENKITVLSQLNMDSSETPIEFNQLSTEAINYLASVDYTDVPYTQSNINNYVSTSGNVQIAKRQSLSGLSSGNIFISNIDSIDIYIDLVSSNTYDIGNLLPNHTYMYSNNSTKGKVIAKGQVRAIYMNSIKNMRDLGGWQCDNGTIKYGKIFRSGKIEDDNTLTAYDLNQLQNNLCIGAELDFRTSTETNDTPNIPNAKYRRYDFEAYSSVFKYADSKTKFIDSIKFVFDCVKKDIPIVFHCSAGADRTGTLAFVLECILGVSRSDLDKDYELTSFYTNRPRTYANYVSMINYIGTLSGTDFNEKIINWLLANGISQSDINDFRNSMIESDSAITPIEPIEPVEPEPSYTNILPTLTFTENKRYNSSGALVDLANYDVSSVINASSEDVIYIYGIPYIQGTNNCYLTLFNGDTFKYSGNATTLQNNGTMVKINDNAFKLVLGNMTSISASYTFDNIRLTLPHDRNNVIITINEKVTD